jgi:hypothetical protein
VTKCASASLCACTWCALCTVQQGRKLLMCACCCALSALRKHLASTCSSLSSVQLVLHHEMPLHTPASSWNNCCACLRQRSMLKCDVGLE